MSYPFELKCTYNFEVYPSAILGNDFNNVTVLGIMDMASADVITNITTLHALVYPLLPTGSPVDPEDYTYLKVRQESGEIRVIAIEWIQPATIEKLNEGICIVRFNRLSPTKTTELRTALSANGFTDFTIDWISEPRG